MRVGIIGQGYVGSAIGIAAHSSGHEVLGIEIDTARLSRRDVPYQTSSQYSDLSVAEIVVIAVPTPLDSKRQPDLSYLKSACESLKAALSTSTLVINESTSFPGTLRNVIAPILGDSHLYASAPERIDPANKKWGIENTPRLVAGLNEVATRRAIHFYRSFCKNVVEVSAPEVAEAAKLFENTFRQVNIALVNEFAQIASALGIPTFETLQAAATKPFGFMSFIPSIGVGGHCIPIDPSYLSYAAQMAGFEASFVKLASHVNESMPDYVARRIEEVVGGSLEEYSIQIAGISYKANVSDTRESPALTLMNTLRNKGAEVIWCDEVVGCWNNERSTPIAQVDIGIIATAHNDVDYSTWKNGGTLVIDVSTAAEMGWPKFL